MANGIVTFDCCSLLQPSECDSNCTAKTAEANAKQEQRKLILSETRPYNKQSCAYTTTFWMEKRLSLFIVTALWAICAWDSCKSMMAGVDRSEFIISVSPRCRFFFPLSRLSMCLCMFCCGDMFRIACGSFGIWRGCTRECQRDRHTESERTWNTTYIRWCEPANERIQVIFKFECVWL